VRKALAHARAVDVSAADLEQYVKQRKDAGRAEATINRELEMLRRAYRLAVKGKLLSAARIPEIELVRLDNVRQGFFKRAEIEALLDQVPDVDLRDFITWSQRAECGGKISKEGQNPWPGSCSLSQ
jgi:site-specific recombinase XerD